MRSNPCMQSKKGRKKNFGVGFKQNDDDDDCGGARRGGCFWSSAPPLDSMSYCLGPLVSVMNFLSTTS